MSVWAAVWMSAVGWAAPPSDCLEQASVPHATLRFADLNVDDQRVTGVMRGRRGKPSRDVLVLLWVDGEARGQVRTGGDGAWRLDLGDASQATLYALRRPSTCVSTEVRRQTRPIPARRDALIGLIQDEGLREVPGAQVILRPCSGEGEPRTGVAGPDGRYRFQDLPAGMYDLEVSGPGLLPGRISCIVVLEGRTAVWDVVLAADAP